MANLYIANNDILGFEHLYLVYDPQGDFDPNNPATWNNDFIIRGGPQTLPEITPILVENEKRIDLSHDALNGDDPITDRNYTLLNGNAASLWASLTAYVDTLGNVDPTDVDRIITDTTYRTFDVNSNSVINTILNQAGIDLRDVMPQDSSEYPAHLSLLDGDGESVYTAYIHDSLINETTTFYKRGGDDTIILEWNNFTGEHAKLHVLNENSSAGLTTVYFDGLDFSDTVFGVAGDDLTVNHSGGEIVRIEDFYLDLTNDTAEGAQTNAFEFGDLIYQRGDDRDNVLHAINTSKKVLLEGFEGNDTLRSYGGNDILIGGIGNDTLLSYGGNDTLIGGAGNDTLRAYGAHGHDILIGGAGNDTLEGSFGYDTVDYSGDEEEGGSGGIQIDFSDFTAIDGFGDQDTLVYTNGSFSGYDGSGIEHFILSNGDDVVDLNSQAGVVNKAYMRFDMLDSDGDNDTFIWGGDGEIIVDSGSIYTNTKYATGVETIEYSGTAIIKSLGHAYTGGSMNDYSNYTSALTFDLGTGVVTDGNTQDTRTYPGSTIGTHYGDTITFADDDNAGHVYFSSGAGDDTVLVNEQGSVWTNFYVYTGGNDTFVDLRFGFRNRVTLGSKVDITASDISFTEVNTYSYSLPPRLVYTHYLEDGYTPHPDAKPYYMIAHEYSSSDLIINFGAYGSMNVGEIHVSKQTRDYVGDYSHLSPYEKLTSTTDLNNMHIQTWDGQKLIFTWSVTDYSTSVVDAMNLNVSLDPDAGQYYSSEVTIYDDVIHVPSGSFGGGAQGNDTIYGNGNGGDGNDIIINIEIRGNGGHGDDVLLGSAGRQDLYGAFGDDILIGNDGDDYLYGQGGNDILIGGQGSDTIYAGLEGDNLLDPGTEDDQLYLGSPGRDTIVFGLGYGYDQVYNFDVNNDLIDLSSAISSLSDLSFVTDSSGTFIYLPDNSILFLSDVYSLPIDLILFENPTVGNLAPVTTDDEVFVKPQIATDINVLANDTDPEFDDLHVSSVTQGAFGTVYLLQDGLVKYIPNIGFSGTDSFTYIVSDGKGGTDMGSVNISVIPQYTPGVDIISGSSSNDYLFGGLGNDTLIGGSGDDILEGGFGSDTADYSSDSAKVNIKLNAGTAKDGSGDTDTFISIENAIGSAFDDSIKGDDTANSLDGNAGDDSIRGRGGDDMIDGGAGNDTLRGNGGADTINGGTGADFIKGGGGIDTIHGDDDNDDINGGGGADVLYGDGGNDQLDGWRGSDTLYGGAGDDVLFGGSNFANDNGGDTLDGGAGSDYLVGSDNNDTLTGGADIDLMRGNLGADTFNFDAVDAVDMIEDFTLGEDILDIADILIGYDPLNDLLSDFVSTSSVGGNTTVAVDADGGADGFVDFVMLFSITTTVSELETNNSIIV